MAFDRLQRLGEDKFRTILNELQRGTPAMNLARKIQQEWKDFQDVGEKTLTQQLNRLRLEAATGAFGKAVAKQIAKGNPVQIDKLKDVSSTALERLEELAGWRRQQAIDVRDKVKTTPVLVGSLLAAANAVFNDYSKLLQDIQRMRYDLGLDKFQGVVPVARGASTNTTLPDGTNIQRQVYEAYTTVEEILDRRGITDDLLPRP